MSPPPDIQAFWNRYGDDPSLTQDALSSDDTTNSQNWEFYAEIAVGRDNEPRRCMPDRLKITELHKNWRGQYRILEDKHGYIQWIFPIREHGMNYHAQPLQLHEIEKMKANPTVIERVITSYMLMLDFYGMELLSAETGLIRRSDNYKARYRNLLERSHNYLRITRILKCLSELGLEHLNVGFLLHVLNEQSESKGPTGTQLNSRSIQSSMDRWWANCLRHEEDRRWIGEEIKRVRQGQGFVFTRGMYEDALERRRRSGRLTEE